MKVLALERCLNSSAIEEQELWPWNEAKGAEYPQFICCANRCSSITEELDHFFLFSLTHSSRLFKGEQLCINELCSLIAEKFIHYLMAISCGLGTFHSCS